MARHSLRSGVILTSIRTEDHGYVEGIFEEDSKVWKPPVLPPIVYPATLIFP
jgi:hypothetical protein